jgi:hypothetical protein
MHPKFIGDSSLSAVMRSHMGDVVAEVANVALYFAAIVAYAYSVTTY